MQADDLKALVETAFPNSQITVTGEDSHFSILIVSLQFAEKNRVERQRMVYSALGDQFTTGQVHALSMKTYTPNEWDAVNG